MRHPHLFTSESVTEGHPDKVADQISDAVLDALLADDPRSRVACETMVTTGLATIFGEITTTSYVHLPKLKDSHPVKKDDDPVSTKGGEPGTPPSTPIDIQPSSQKVEYYEPKTP